MSFNNKYSKYKDKYLKLKKQLGGAAAPTHDPDPSQPMQPRIEERVKLNEFNILGDI